MPKIDIIAAGRMRDKNQIGMVGEFSKRLHWPLNIIEIPDKNPADINDRILDKLDNQAYVIALDETGKAYSSRSFAKKIDTLLHQDGYSTLQFIIGAADGLNDSVRSNSNICISFGKQTWPHMRARIMLVEQIYRAQQILAGHPYHRD